MANPIYPTVLPTNFKYNIEAAEAYGYIVTGPYSRIHFEDNCRPGILFAGTLADALAYISQEIIKHDEWREEGPTSSVRRTSKPRSSSPGRL
jgi:hypothetical protein